MTPHLCISIVLIGVSWIVLLLGYLIGLRKQLSLIAGLAESKVRDRDGLALWIGTGLLSIGVLDVLLSLTLFATSVSPPLLIVVYLTVNLVGAAVLVIRMQRYIS